MLDFFLSKLKILNINDNYEIKLRPHPSENSEKYEKWIKSNQSLNISMTINSLEEDIAWADIVIGYESFALVIASADLKDAFHPNYLAKKCKFND